MEELGLEPVGLAPKASHSTAYLLLIAVFKMPPKFMFWNLIIIVVELRGGAFWEVYGTL